MPSPSGRLAASLLCLGLVASGSLAQRRPEATPTPAPADEGKPSEKYTFSHLGLDPALAKNIRLEHYESGHMVYIHKPSLVKLTGDVVAF